MILVSFHQAGRVADWLDDLALAHEGLVSEMALKTSAVIRARVDPYGPNQLNRAWDRFLGSAAPGPQKSVRIRPSSPPDSSPPAQSYAALPPSPPRPSPPARPARLFNPTRVLLLGDSMMLEGLGPQIQRALKKYEGLTVNRDGRYGTGLTRLDNFDWLAYFDQMLDKYRPDLIILTLGANDPQDMVDQGRRINVGDEEWTAIYAGRVADLLARAEARRVRIFWIGLPVMGLEPYGRRVIHINQVVEAVCKVAPNCRYWDSRHAVADSEGRYVAFWSDGLDKSVRIRARDSIHLTEDGGRMMAEKFLAETSGWADYRQNNKPGAALGPVSALKPLAPSAGEGEDEGGETLAGVSEHKLYSPARGRETVYILAEPRGPGVRPVVLMLHGAWDGARTWREHLGDETLAKWADRWGLILVMADGEPFGWYVDGRESAIETYLMEELLPHLGRTHPEMDQSRLAVVGLSMGGHGALTLALKHPQKFRAVGSLSGVTDPAAHAGDRPLHRQLKIEEALGPAGPEGSLWRERGAAGLTEKCPKNLAGRPLILSVGREDRLTLAENRAYHQLLNRLKISHVYRERPGGHDWPYWAGELPAQLEYISGLLYRAEGLAGP